MLLSFYSVSPDTPFRTDLRLFDNVAGLLYNFMLPVGLLYLAVNVVIFYEHKKDLQRYCFAHVKSYATEKRCKRGRENLKNR